MRHKSVKLTVAELQSEKTADIIHADVKGGWSTILFTNSCTTAWEYRFKYWKIHKPDQLLGFFFIHQKDDSIIYTS